MHLSLGSGLELGRGLASVLFDRYNLGLSSGVRCRASARGIIRVRVGIGPRVRVRMPLWLG